MSFVANPSQLTPAYNAFTRYGQKDKSWSGNHRINFKSLSRAVAIRKQLKKFLDRFNIPLVSCGSDHVTLRKCLVSGYFKVSWGYVVKAHCRTPRACCRTAHSEVRAKEL